MEDQVFATEKHVARISVMETSTGKFRGYVFIRRVEEGPEVDVPYQTDADFDRDDLARDAARQLATATLAGLEF